MAIVVKKQPGESDDKLIAKFRKKIMAEQIIMELKDREFHKPPSLIKKERLAAFRRRSKR